MKKLLVGVLFCSLFGIGLSAQVSRGALTIVGSFAPAVSLTSTSYAQSLGSGAIRVNVQPSADGTATLTLLVRGNTAYALTASVASITGADPNSTVIVTPLNTNSTGARTIAQITANTSAANLAIAGAPAVILNGSRVSRGGNDLTPDNALAIQVRVDLPVGATSAALTFRTSAQ